MCVSSRREVIGQSHESVPFLLLWLPVFFFPPLVVSDVNQLGDLLRDTFFRTHTYSTHTHTHTHTHESSPTLPLFLALHFAASPTCCSEPLGPRQLQMSFFLVCFSSPWVPVKVNLHLVGARCWDAPVWFRRWLRAGEWGRLLLCSLDAACHSQNHSSYSSGKRAHRCNFFFFCVRVNETGSRDGLWMPEDATSSYGNRECLHSVGCCQVTEDLDATGGRARINICVCPLISNHRQHGR